jgi:hypothetical protein
VAPDPHNIRVVARAQRQLTALQWVIPVLTGAVLVVNARMGEQQRPTQVTGGLVRRLLPGLWVAASRARRCELLVSR